MQDFGRLAIEVPEVLLPAPWVDVSRWAVIACDQHTSEPEFWRQVEEFVGDSPSTLRLILPEAFLAGDGADAGEDPVPGIHGRMREYLDGGVFGPPAPRFIYLERSTPRAPRRRGLVVALDLEQYDFQEGARSLVRASESTVQERLPARIAVRRGAPLELPHAIVLVDDPEATVIEPVGDRFSARPPLYDADLMLGAGRVRGWAVEDEAALASIHAALTEQARPEAYQQRYGVADSDVLLFAVGDGNHALAAARSLWQELRAGLGEDEAATHPARYALVELVNVHDPGVVFEPIHRLVFGVDPGALLEALPDWFDDQGSTCRFERAEDHAVLRTRLGELRRDPALHALGTVTAEGLGVMAISEPKSSLAVESLQGFLDAYTASLRDARVDYIHGESAVRGLCAEPDRVGFLLPPMRKDELFGTLVREGALPPKTFSLGEADEKRFYLEARSLRPSTS